MLIDLLKQGMFDKMDLFLNLILVLLFEVMVSKSLIQKTVKMETR